MFTTLPFLPLSRFITPSFFDLIPLMGLGVMGSLGHYFLSQAAKYAEVVVITPFEYTSFIFVSLLGYIFYNEVPDISVFVGAAMIIVSGIYIIYRVERKK